MPPRLRKFLSYYRPYRHILALDLLCAALVSAIALILPLIARHLTQVVLGESVSAAALPEVYALAALMLGLVALSTACETVVDYQGHMMGTRMERDLRAELFAHYQTLSFSFYDEQRTGQLMSRLTHDVWSLGEFFHHGPEDLLIALVKLMGVLVVSWLLSPALTLMIALFVPVITVYAFTFNRRMNRALRQSKAHIAAVNAQVEDTLAGIRVVQSFGNDDLEAAKFAQANAAFVESRRAGHRAEAWFSSGMSAFTQLITVAVIVAGAVSLVAGGLSLADLLTYLLYVAVLVDPVARLVNFAHWYQEGVTGFQRVQDMLDLSPEIHDAPDAQTLETVRGAIGFHGVSFRYREDHPPVLRDLSLTVQAGEYVALVGPSGVGKTTLCALIPRFYDVSGGAITLDGHDIRGLSLRWLRQQIGVVQQDTYLFAGSVADNIRYGQPDASFDAVVAAAKQADAHGFITALPDGYATDIGQRGVKLSGGQQQRLSIARVFLKDPAILIFDEATSALDRHSEGAVQAALERLAQGRTTLVIAHRLSTIRNAERILVLDDGGLAEAGSHAELLERGGLYAQLVAAQVGADG